MASREIEEGEYIINNTCIYVQGKLVILVRPVVKHEVRITEM